MALKSDRHELMTDVSFFMNEVKERGFIAVLSTGGSGSAMDQSAALVTCASPSGKAPMGLLLNDMVNIDQTRQHINWHKDEVQKGGKVTLLQHGWVVTNAIDPADTIVAGQTAFVGNSGYLSNGDPFYGPGGGSASASGVVGRFLSSKDEDGYAKVFVSLPNTNHPNV